jgi:hypothetical protein
VAQSAFVKSHAPCLEQVLGAVLTRNCKDAQLPFTPVVMVLSARMVLSTSGSARPA